MQLDGEVQNSFEICQIRALGFDRKFVRTYGELSGLNQPLTFEIEKLIKKFGKGFGDGNMVKFTFFM